MEVELLHCFVHTQCVKENLGRRVLPGNCKRVQQVHGQRRFGEDVASTVSDKPPKLHVAVVNGWLQYKRDLKTSEAASGSQKDLMQFTLDVAETLTKVNKAYPRKSHGRMSQRANVKTSRRRARRPEPRIAARFDQK
ncbi:hypothetical protein Tsp_05124 [Trichinella spiralis]|uniref:hypothetical protein n=1 Tax=Trichinella spiralis TaxID=6334 RepID=UPI0001EFD1D1|nr:hypothetical protein Tsp_05124 [Trichinella spiralis]